MKQLTLLLIVLLAASACQSPRDKALKKISETEKKMRADSTLVINPRLAEELISSYTYFAEQFPKDSLAPECLFKAAEVNSGIGQPLKAIALYKKAKDEYPSYKKADYCVFLQGFVYENQLRDTANARVIYEAFLANYPSHPLTDAARFSLENLGKPDEEVIRQFEAKAGVQ
jgi:outer membrane protein assembly factor BamD (BamD/ComL family)